MILDAIGLDPAGTALDGATICVIGSGPAGLTVARRLAAAGKDVIMLEAGGEEISAESQDVYNGRNSGDPYFSLDTCRLRYYGGTSNHWGGWSRPLETVDFERKEHVSHTGWPIAKTDLDPYYDDAAKILALGPLPPKTPLDGAVGDLVRTHWMFAKNKRLGPLYRDEIDGSERIRLVLNANVVDVELDPVSGAIRHVLFCHYAPDSPLFRVVTPIYVLACGGIENPRFLLNANRQLPAGLGNQNDLVGRFFMEHPHFGIGRYIDLGAGFDLSRNFIVTTPDFIARTGILNCSIVLHRYFDEDWYDDLDRRLVQELCEIAPDRMSSVLGVFGLDCTMGEIRVMSEQAPNPESRITLLDDVDQFGLRRIQLNWQKMDIDRKTIRTTAFRVSEALATADTGRVKIADWLLDKEAPFPTDHRLGGRHHMGTTRMAASERQGVVDANCRVFGTPNLYIAGSSVFPTGGSANPTLTIVQLALRLADHLAMRA